MGRRRRAGDPARAVGYVRVSTDEQRLGVAAQRDALAAWTRTHGAELVAVFIDEGVSGAAGLEQRRGLFDALAELEARGAGVLLVARLDRVARDVAIAAMVGEQVRRRGARIVACDGGDGGDDPSSRLIRDVLYAFAAHERRMIAARTSAALQAKRARGERYCGTPRLGERFVGGRLTRDALEVRSIAAIERMRARGLSVREIVDALAKRPEHRPRGARWHQTTVVRVLRRREPG